MDYPKTKIYILQKNGELWKGKALKLNHDEHAIIAALSPDHETVEDVIEEVNNQEFPWNFDYFAGAKVETNYSKKDLDFVPIDDIDLDLEQLNPETLSKQLYDDDDFKRVFIDLQHRKVFSLCTGNAHPRSFPKDLKREYIKKKIPEDFTPIRIELNSSEWDSDLQVATELLKDLRECNHPSGKLFESLGACIDQHYYWGIYWEEIKMRPATAAEFRRNWTAPEKIVAESIRGRIMRGVPPPHD